MKNILQNIKSSFSNFKELFGIMLSDDIQNDNYEVYINGKDAVLSKTAQELKEIEQEQESKRLSFFNVKISKSIKSSAKPKKDKTQV